MLHRNYGKDHEYTAKAAGLRCGTGRLPRYAMRHAEGVTGTQARLSECRDQELGTPQNQKLPKH